MTSTRPTGRPRDEALDAAIMDAAIQLVNDRGYPAVSLEAIAERARTSKTAIYRRWPRKAAIVMDAFLTAAEPLIAAPAGLRFRDSIVAQMTALADFFQTNPRGRTVAGLIAEAQHDPELADAIRQRWLEPRRNAAVALYDAARQTGELRDDVEDATLTDALYGPLYFRLLLGHAPIDKGFVEHTVDVVLAGVAPESE